MPNSYSPINTYSGKVDLLDVDKANGKPVRAAFLAATLRGVIDDDDYIAKSASIIGRYHVPECLNISNTTISIADINEAIFKESIDKNLFSGIGIIDKHWLLTCQHDLGRAVNGDMLQYWLNYCDNDDLYRLVDPLNNKKCQWNPTFHGKMKHERIGQYHIGHRQYLEFNVQKLSGDPSTIKLSIDYIKPSRFFDVTSFTKNKVTTCIVGNICYYDSMLMSYIHAGYLVRIVQEEEEINKMKTLLWLGDFDLNKTRNEAGYGDTTLSILNYILGLEIYRKYQFPEWVLKGIWHHFMKEGESLMHILPHLYTKWKTEESKLLDKIHDMRVKESIESANKVATEKC